MEYKMTVFLFSEGDDIHTGSIGEYNQVDYDAHLSEFSISRNDDGSVTVFHPTIGTDTLIHIDGIWSDADQSWYSIDDAIAQTADAPAAVAAPVAPAAPAAPTVVLFSEGDDIHTGSADAYNQVDYDPSLSEFAISQNDDGSVTVAHATIGTDTLVHIDGIWSDADQSWYSIEDAIAQTPDTLAVAPAPAAPTPAPAPAAPAFEVSDYGVVIGTDADDVIVDTNDVNSLYGGLGDDQLVGQAGAYSQADYDGFAHDYSFTQNADGSVTVTNATFGTDTLTHIDGIWFGEQREWVAIDSLLTSVPAAPVPVAPTAPTPSADFEVSDYGVVIGTDADDVIVDTSDVNSLYGGLGDDTLIGLADEYSQVDYDGFAKDYTFTQNADGSITVTNATFGTDTLTNIDGVWFGGQEEWVAIEYLTGEDAVVADPAPIAPVPVDDAPVDDAPVDDAPVDAPAPAPLGPNTGTLVDGVITGSNDVNDTLVGDAGDNTFFAGRGTDVIQGGEGNDTLNVDGDIIEWTFTRNDDGSVTMTHPTWGENTLVGIEQIFSQRAGETFSIDDAIDSTAGLPAFRLDADNVINGTNGDDFIAADASVTGFYGGTGNDTFLADEDGFVQVNYDGSSSEFNITENDDGSITVDHPIWGVDTLINIDALIFTGVEPGVGGASSGPFEFIATDDLFG